VTNAPSATPSNPPEPGDSGESFPKSARILRSSDFRKVYDEGSRFSCAHFAAFFLVRTEQQDGPKVGFTVSRASGKAVVRNRMKRRMREAVRRHLSGLAPVWAIVFNPRRAILTAKRESIEGDVKRLFAKCKNS
jgi:ribonuclease P protein component